MTLAWFNNKCRCLIFKLITDSVSITTEKNLNFVGLTVGDQPLYFSKFQKIVWDDDTYDVIKKEFDEMCIKIEERSRYHSMNIHERIRNNYQLNLFPIT